MSRKNLAKTTDEVYMDLLARYRAEYGSAVRMEDVGQWIDRNGLLPAPRMIAARVHTRKLKQAARRNRIRDAQGRKVRTMIPAKFEKVDARGNRIFDVVWDHLHESSLDHLLTHFVQRDDIIEKQSHAATRDWQSALDNNPNLIGDDRQIKFGFMRDEPLPQIQETLGETPTRTLGEDSISPDAIAEQRRQRDQKSPR
jgi:hypothetical protein